MNDIIEIQNQIKELQKQVQDQTEELQKQIAILANHAAKRVK